jgi:hypothetical protein
LSDAVEPSSFHFEFQVTRAEDRFFRALAINNLKLLGDQRIMIGVPVLAYALIVVWGYTAADRGWLTQGSVCISIVVLAGVSSRVLRGPLFHEPNERQIVRTTRCRPEYMAREFQ